MDPLVRFRDAHSKGLIPDDVYDLTLKRFPLIVGGIVGNVLWCQYRVEDEEDSEGQPLVEYEDLLSGDVLDLTQRKEPEHYWYW